MLLLIRGFKMKKKYIILFILIVFFYFYLESCETLENISYNCKIIGNFEENKPIENIIFLNEYLNQKKFGTNIGTNPFIYDNSIGLNKIYFNLLEISFYENNDNESKVEILNAVVLDSNANNIGIFMKKDDLINYWESNQNIGKEIVKLKRKIENLYLPNNFRIKKGEKKIYYFVFKSIQKFEEFEKFIITIKFSYNDKIKIVKTEISK